jgi:hypothetical protein
MTPRFPKQRGSLRLRTVALLGGSLFKGSFRRAASKQRPVFRLSVIRKPNISFIRVETETEIARVTLDHPTGNRINFAIREELLQAFHQVTDSKARVLVVRGTGSDFSLE